MNSTEPQAQEQLQFLLSTFGMQDVDEFSGSIGIDNHLGASLSNEELEENAAVRRDQQSVASLMGTSTASMVRLLLFKTSPRSYHLFSDSIDFY